MKRFIPFVGDDPAARAWDRLFSRDVLGAVVVGSGVGKVVEKCLNLYFDTTVGLLYGWSIAVVFGVLIFVYWHKIEAATDEAADKVEDAVDD